MCDVKKYEKIYEDIKTLQPEDTLQLVLEAETEEQRSFYEMVGDFLLQKKQTTTGNRKESLLVKKYILIAGVNGAGKSTLYQSLQSLQGMPRVNTDEILRDFGDWRNMADVMTAGKIAVKKIARYFDEGITFNQETTLCGKSIINNSNFPH